MLAAMREIDVRRALHGAQIRKLMYDDPLGLIVDELGIEEGKFRIDVAVINSRFHGFEIKSASDNLDRLPAQQNSYNKIFDHMTLVADEKHVVQAMKIVPPWWGLVVATKVDDKVRLEEIWRSQLNPKVDSYALCQLLWRDEALEVLKDLGLHRELRNRSRTLMWKLLATTLSASDLRGTVSAKIRLRKDWR